MNYVVVEQYSGNKYYHSSLTSPCNNSIRRYCLFLSSLHCQFSVSQRIFVLLLSYHWYIVRTLKQEFSCEFCEIFKNTFFYRTPPVAASVAISQNSPLYYCFFFFGRQLSYKNTLRLLKKIRNIFWFCVLYCIRFPKEQPENTRIARSY